MKEFPTSFTSREWLNYIVEGIDLENIYNYHEVIVLEIMRSIYASDQGLCRCQLCVEDVYALSMNKINPRYIQTTSLPKILAKNIYNQKSAIYKEVEQAILKVAREPNHDARDSITHD